VVVSPQACFGAWQDQRLESGEELALRGCWGRARKGVSRLRLLAASDAEKSQSASGTSKAYIPNSIESLR
jgi:hypothetical protein